MRLRGRFFEPPARGSYFLFGPRGTGKSLWCQQAYPRALRFDLLDPGLARELAARPERLVERLDAQPAAATVIVDEVQRVPEILSVVHRLLESKRRLRFVLTGSSARKLRREGVNLLAGRAAVRQMHPFLAAELGSSFSLARALELGLVPLVLGAPEPRDALRAYAALYLREEVQHEALVRDLGAFARFLEVAAFSHAQTLNVSELARECQVSRKVAESYLAVLEDLLLSFRVPVFTRRAKRELVAHTKFFYFDTGVYRSLRPSGPLDRPEEIEGAALEGLVAQHLRAWIGYRGERDRLHYWRTRSGVEVDFVVYGESGLAAVEVKRSAEPRPGDLRGLAAFGMDYPTAVRLLLHCGTERSVRDGIVCLPVEEFLLSLRPDREIASWGVAPVRRPRR